MRTSPTLYAVIFTATSPATALAADAAPAQTWWQALLVPIMSVVGVMVAAFLSTALLKLVRVIEKKWNVDVPVQVENMMIDKARLLVAWAEEKMETAVLHEGAPKTPGAERIAEVTKALVEFAEANGHGKTWTAEKCRQLAEGVLHLERSEGVGSEGARAAKLAAAEKK